MNYRCMEGYRLMFSVREMSLPHGYSKILAANLGRAFRFKCESVEGCLRRRGCMQDSRSQPDSQQRANAQKCQ